MGENTITCPSGLVGVVRNMKGAEFNLLSDRAGMRSGASFDRILKNCWVRTEDQGRAYPDEMVSPIRWSKMLSADRFYALVQIRTATWGTRYDFVLPCPDCGERIKDHVDVSDLVVNRIPDQSCAAFREKSNRFELWVPDPAGLAPLPDFDPYILAAKRHAEGDWPDDMPVPDRGWAIAVKLLDGVAEVAGAKEARKRPEARVTVALKHRMVDVLHTELSGDRDAVERWVEALDGETLFDVFDAAEEVDGGIETEWEDFECTSCGCDDPVELPFDLDFWMPRKRRKKGSSGRRRRRSRSKKTARS
jgi:hypothetical protein